MSKFKPGPAKNKSNMNVVIYTINGLGDYPVIGQYEPEPGVWHTSSWTLDGLFHIDDFHPHNDLFPNVEPMKSEIICTVVEYDTGCVPYGVGMNNTLRPFVRKKVKLTIEEIVE